MYLSAMPTLSLHVYDLPSLLNLTRGGGARLRRPSRERTRTILPWIAQETQYWSLRYILGTVYSGKTEASEMSPARSQFQGSSHAGVRKANSTAVACAILADTPIVYVYRISWDVRMAADSTMLRMVNLLIALSLGVHREQLEQRMGLTWPRPFLLRPL